MIESTEAHRPASVCFVLFLGLVLPAAIMTAEEPEIEDEIGWHVVAPGETLQIITERYLGTSELWPDNHKLNPGIKDPDKLWPGQRIRVITERQIPAHNAEIREVSNQVNKKKQRLDWEDAARGDQLESKDGVRTREKSSTVLAFDDGSSLTLNELSQVFLKEMETTVTGVRRDAIEVLEGQVDLQLRAPRPDRKQVEIIVGAAISRPKAGSTGVAETRTRLTGDTSQLMVFGGSSAMEAGGRVVEVPKGMGTLAERGAAPKPPEKLLPAPAAGQPAKDSQWGYANPDFSWRAVPRAASYTVEVCADAGCGALVDRATGLTERRWRPQGLPAGELYWRVLAVSASGLDGYASRVQRFRILSDRPDLQAPLIAAAIVGQGEIVGEDRVLLGAGGALRLEVIDDASGVERVRYRHDDGPWKPYGGEDLAPGAGVSQLEIEARDRLGRERQLVLRFAEAETEPPAPLLERVPSGTR